MWYYTTGGDLSHPSGPYKVCDTQHPMAHRTHSSLCHSRRGVRSWTGHHEWFGHHPRGMCQTPGRKFWVGRSHGGSDAEVRKCAVHHCILDSSEIDKIPGICDPQVGNSGSVNCETLPNRHSSYGAGQTVNGGEVKSHSFRLELGPKNLRLLVTWTRKRKETAL